MKRKLALSVLIFVVLVGISLTSQSVSSSSSEHSFAAPRAVPATSNFILALPTNFDVDRTDDKQLFSFQPFVFLGRNDCANDSRDDHARACALMGIASSTLTVFLGQGKSPQQR